VMVERSGPGLYTANLGNLKRGEEVTINVQWAQLLSVRDHQVRIAIPTVVAERYGDAHAQGGLAPHQSTEASLLVEYPLSLALSIEGELAKASVSCASHVTQISSGEGPGGKIQIVSLQTGATLDRDVVINLHQLPTQQFLVSEPNPDGTTTVLASFYPTLAKKFSPLALKILVDCSGSMEGDSIEQAREAVHQVMQQVQPGDYVSYSRFGAQVAHNFTEAHRYNPEESTPEEMLPASDKKIANIGRLIRNTHANMGGTEMRGALISTINDVALPNIFSFGDFVSCLLLITDGDIWDHQGVVRAAHASGLRIFAIGVGSSPAESLLRELTETTGGACAFVTPNEPMAPIALRMVQSMRSAQNAKLTVNWPQDAQLKSFLPSSVFENDTIHAFATLTAPPVEMPTLTVETPHGVTTTPSHPLNTAGTAQAHPNEMGALARIAAYGRMLADTAKSALKTALTYNLISEQTNLLLVHVREQADKTTELPTLEQIKQMAAAGQHGLGTARSEIHCAPSFQLISSHQSAPFAAYSRIQEKTDSQILFRAPERVTGARHEVLNAGGMDKLDIPAFLRRQASDPQTPETPPRLIIEIFNDLSLRYTDIEEAIDKLFGHIRGDVTESLMEKLSEMTFDKYYGCVALLLWISEHKKISDCSLTRHALRILERIRNEMGEDKLGKAYSFLDFALERASADHWNAADILTT